MDTMRKQPADVVDYQVDCAEFFKDYPGDDIQSVTVEVAAGNTGDSEDLVLGPTVGGTPYPAVVLQDDPAPTWFKVWVGAGKSGVTYKVSCLIETEGGRRKEFDFKVKVKNQ